MFEYLRFFMEFSVVRFIKDRSNDDGVEITSLHNIPKKSDGDDVWKVSLWSRVHQDLTSSETRWGDDKQVENDLNKTTE